MKVREEAVQRMITYLEANKSDLTTIRSINRELFEEYSEEETLHLKPIDKPFNDGILLPRTSLTDSIEKVKHRFEDPEVNLIVRTVKNSMQSDYWFVKLCEDSAP